MRVQGLIRSLLLVVLLHTGSSRADEPPGKVLMGQEP
jgi:hypothetical protein